MAQASVPPPLRVVLADPSEAVLDHLGDLLTHPSQAARRGLPGFAIAARVTSGDRAVEAILAEQPSIAILAPGLPLLDVLEVAREVMAEQPVPLLVVAEPPLDPTIAAAWIDAGVLDVLIRPAAGDPLDAWQAFRRELRSQVRLVANIRVIRHIAGGSGQFKLVPPTSVAGAHSTLPPLVGVVASTGGPPALAHLLRDLGAGCPAALLVVQHIGAGFIRNLAEWLDRECPLAVRVAREGEAPEAGRVYLAPTHAHLTLSADGRLRFDLGPPLGYGRPSGDVLFRSLVPHAGIGHRSVMGVILTGLGADGAAGLAALRRAGAWTIAQDRGSSAIWGMPKAAVEAEAVCEVLPLPRIGARVRRLLEAAPTGPVLRE